MSARSPPALYTESMLWSQRWSFANDIRATGGSAAYMRSCRVGELVEQHGQLAADNETSAPRPAASTIARCAASSCCLPPRRAWPRSARGRDRANAHPTDHTRARATCGGRDVAALGALRQRALLGHGARGLQRRRRRLGLPPPRHGAQQGLSLGRGRPGRHLRPLPAARLRPGPVERPRPDPQGAPRSGSRPSEGNHGEDVKEYYFYLDNTPTHSYMKYLYKYPQARVPLSPADRGEPPPATVASPSTSCSTPASSTRTAISTSSSSTPRPTPEDICIRIEAFNRGPDAGDPARPAAPLVPQHLGLGPRRRAPSRSSRSGRATGLHRAWWPTTPRPTPLRQSAVRVPARASAHLYGPTRRPTRCSPTTRPTPSGSTARTRAAGRPHVKDAFHRHVIDGEDCAVNPSRPAPRRASTTRGEVVRRAARPCCACV